MESSRRMKEKIKKENFLKSCSFLEKCADVSAIFYKTLVNSFWFDEINNQGL